MMQKKQLFPNFYAMPGKLLSQGESLAKAKTRSLETKSDVQAIFSNTRHAVVALALSMGMTHQPAHAEENSLQFAGGTTTTLLASYAAAAPERIAPQTDFLGGLDQHLKALANLGIVAKETATGINREFRKYAEGNPKIYRQPGFEYAIPTITPFKEPYGPLIATSLERSQSRKLSEIIGMDTVTEVNITEVFRRMFASTKEDGIFYEIFVKDELRLLLEDGFLRTNTGAVDKQAIYDSIDSDKASFGRWQERFDEMRQDGRLKRFVQAVNNAIMYAEKKALTFKPAQVRKGLVHTASCIAAKPDANPSLYADSCSYTMTWMGERPHPGAIEIEFYDVKTGEGGYKRIMAPWDAKYAREVYGPVFTDTQAKANDNFWRDYFKLYEGTARANRSDLEAAEWGQLVRVEKAIGRVAKLLRHYAEGNPFEGKKVSTLDIQAALDEAKRLKIALEAAASPSLKADEGYKDTMGGFSQVLAAAAKIGVK